MAPKEAKEKDAEADAQQKADSNQPDIRFRMKNFCGFHWRGVLSVVIPLLFVPILFLTPTMQYRCLYVVIIVALFWISEVIPLYMTSLIPIVAFPVLGVLDSLQVCQAYFSNALILFAGGLIVALAIEYSNLHNRIALGVIMIVGCSPRRLHLGLICTATFLSMWTPNTAVTAMFCPVIKAVLAQLSDLGVVKLTTDQRVAEEEPPYPSKTVLCYYLGVAYASTIGGCGSLIGTGTNITFKGIYETRFPQATDISFVNFFLFAAPPTVLQAIFTYFWLQFLYQGWLRPNSPDAKEVSAAKEREGEVKDYISKKYKELGDITAHELQVLLLFTLMIVLLFLRKPGIFPGYADFLNEKKISGSVPITLIVLLLFLLPVKYNFLSYLFGKRPEEEKPLGSVLGWKFVQDNMPWGLLFLLGGGFALAKGLQHSGLSVMIGEAMSSILKPLPVPIIQFLCIITAVFMTAFSSNVAIANILIPILCEFAVAIHLHPLYLIFPAGMGCNLAFHLPVSTPPNAMVAGFADIRSKQMAVGGIGPTVICIFFLFLASQSWMYVIFPQVSTFPEWAKAN